jgi:hypothetical protein
LRRFLIFIFRVAKTLKQLLSALIYSQCLTRNAAFSDYPKNPNTLK